MSLTTKQIKEKVLKRFLEEQDINKKNTDNIETQIDEIVDNILSVKKNDEDSDSVQEEHSDSDENLKLNVKELEDENEKSITPYVYIDYNTDSVELAKNMDYKTVKIDRDGLTKTVMNNISSGKLFNLNNFGGKFKSILSQK